jgi:hypothetical protein
MYNLRKNMEENRQEENRQEENRQDENRRFIAQMMKRQLACGMVAAVLHRFMGRSQKLADANVVLEPLGPGMYGFGNWYRFQVTMPLLSPFYKVSISVPPDEELPRTYETALVGLDGSLTYVPEAGYEDICRFVSMQEVVDELLRLATYTGLETEAPNADDDMTTEAPNADDDMTTEAPNADDDMTTEAPNADDDMKDDVKDSDD